jgi:hypothetical protein
MWTNNVRIDDKPTATGLQKVKDYNQSDDLALSYDCGNLCGEGSTRSWACCHLHFCFAAQTQNRVAKYKKTGRLWDLLNIFSRY